MSVVDPRREETDSDFWLHLDLAYEVLRDTGSSVMLQSVIGDYAKRGAEIDAVVARDAGRWAMLRFALIVCKKYWMDIGDVDDDEKVMFEEDHSHAQAQEFWRRMGKEAPNAA